MLAIGGDPVLEVMDATHYHLEILKQFQVL
jgi:hypothetical protein